MKTVTALTAQKRNKGRLNLYLDDEFFCGIDAFTALSNRIKVGVKISEEKLNDLILTSEYNTALSKAVNYISRSFKTKKQMEDYLKGKNYPDIVVDKVLAKLIEYGYVDDLKYAKTFTEQRSKGKGNRLISLELTRRGINKSTVEKVMENSPDEAIGAYAVADRYLKNKEKTFENRTKCYRYLLSKGFSYDTAKEVLDRIFFGGDDEDFTV